MAAAATAKVAGITDILFATDFSTTSDRALAHAVALANGCGAAFHIAHVVSSSGYALAGQDALLNAEDLANIDARFLEQRLVSSGALTGIKHDVSVRHGDVWQQIHNIIRSRNISLIVVGTHGRTGLRKILLGSVAEKIFRHACCPVMAVGPCSPKQPRGLAEPLRILYPTDLSPESAQAASFINSLALSREVNVTPLHVIPPLQGEPAGDRERVESGLQERMRAILPLSPIANASEFLVRTGEVAEEVLVAADRMHADLIVLGLRPPEIPESHVGWVYAYRMVREACCPVVTVRSSF